MRQFKFEGRVAAFMEADGGAVEPAFRDPVGRADDKKHALPFPFLRNRDGLSIPSVVRFVFHAGQRGAPAEGDENVQREVVRIEPGFFLADVFLVEFEFPGSVEVEPFFAFEIGAGMLGEWDGHFSG